MKKAAVFLFFILSLIGFSGCGEDTAPSEPIPMSAPPDFTTVPISDNAIRLTWTDDTDFETGFKIQRSFAEGDNWIEIADLPENTELYVDEGLSEGQSFQYRMNRYNADVTSPFTEPVAATTLPRAPVNLAASRISETSLHIVWADSSAVEDGFEIHRRLSTVNDFDSLTVVAANTTAYDDANLQSASTYVYKVRALKGSQASEWSNTAQATTTLYAPPDLAAAPTSDSSVQLTWTDKTDFEEGFKIQRSPAGEDAWIEIADLPENTEAYVDEGLSEGLSLQYRINFYTMNAASPFTEPVVATTLPKAPITLTASRLSETSLHIEWIDSSFIEEGFEIHRRISFVADFDSITTVAANTATYDDLNLQSAQTYIYKVRTLTGSQVSVWSNTAQATTTVYTPAAPENLHAESLPGNSAILTWEDRSINELGFAVQNSLAIEEGWITLDSIQLADQRTYNAENLMSSTTYYFRVCAYNDSGSSPYSNIAELLTPEGLPLAPSNLNAEAPTWRSVELNWNDNSGSETGFILQRRIEPQMLWSVVDSIASNTSTCVDSTVTPCETYSYRIKAYNEIGRSAWSNIAAVDVPHEPPETPSGLVVEARSATSIRVEWNDVLDEDMYLIERRMTGEPGFQPVHVNGANTTVFIDTGMMPETWYAYRIQAVNDQGVSEFCDPDSAQTHSQIVFTDTFEEYESGFPPDNPVYWLTTAGVSWVRVDGNNPHESDKSLHFYDAIDDDSSMAYALLAHLPITSGIASCWIYLDADGYFSVMGGDP